MTGSDSFFMTVLPESRMNFLGLTFTGTFLEKNPNLILTFFGSQKYQVSRLLSWTFVSDPFRLISILFFHPKENRERRRREEREYQNLWICFELPLRSKFFPSFFQVSFSMAVIFKVFLSLSVLCHFSLSSNVFFVSIDTVCPVFDGG